MRLVSRAEARASGAIHFFSGIACKHGHVCKRLTSSAECTACKATRKNNLRATNPDSIRNAAKAHRERYPEKIKLNRETWKNNNLDKVRQHRKKWLQANKEVNNCRNRRRRAKIANTEGSHTSKQIFDLLSNQKHKCANCNTNIKSKYHADHIMPIFLGGSNKIQNIQLLCPTCNVKKAHKDPIKWAQQEGRLL